MKFFGRVFTFKAVLFTLYTLALSGTATAQSIDFGLVGDTNSGRLGLVGEYYAAPSLEYGAFSIGWGIAGKIESDGDVWAGVGIAASLALSETMFAEASLMPGYYHANETVLGGNLQFRTLIGLGAQLSDSTALILSVDHLSNANTHPFNPGMNSAALRFRTRF